MLSLANKPFTLSHCAECHYAECHYAECHYAECRGVEVLSFSRGRIFSHVRLFYE
jgi:hypothetical protein